MTYYITNIAPHYRKTLWLGLMKDESIDAHFFFSNTPIQGIKTIDFTNDQFSAHQHRLHHTKEIKLLRGIIWQRGILTRCLKDRVDHVVFMGAPAYITTWIGALICRCRGIGVSFWGHGLRGRERIHRQLRAIIFYKLANNLLLYERRAKDLLIKKGFSPDKLYVVFNSLAYHEHLKLREQFKSLKKQNVLSFFKDNSLPTLVFIGRLTQEKKIHLLLESAYLINRNAITVNVLIIGDGVERKFLYKIGDKALNEGWLHFVGACYDEMEIGKYLYVSDLCVSPGNVGLTAIHSLSMGTPVCSHNNQSKQMPEVQSIIEGQNGFVFEENNVLDLNMKIRFWLENNTDRAIVRKRCFEIIDKYYNPNYQIEVFRRALGNIKPSI